MMEEKTPRASLPGHEAEDDVEIVEVVGMDDGEARPDEEVEVVFDQTERPPTAPPAPEEVSAHERLIRLRADFENFKRRVERERQDFYRQAASGLVGRLLPVVDNLERAMAAGLESENESAIRDGVALIHRQLLEELRKEGLRPVEALGRAFDPRFHEAVATDPDSDRPANTVTAEFQRGYFLHDRLLRPALVRVSRPPEEEASGECRGEES